MNRTTIDFGIDLGTTNSSIALLSGTTATIFKNNEDLEFTPSVVWVDKKDRLFVGQAAKDRLFDDPDNSVAEFKLQMGKDQPYTFKRSGRSFKPEDLSAEVLKSLRATVRQRTGEEVEAAVITTPADFDLPENAATSRAAKLAGFSQSPLLQEPVAAALAYGFQSKKEKVFWFVYDLGGGTFDAAIIQVKEGQIEIVNHGGDKYLGGKNIDWSIVDEILAPAAAREHGLRDFKRGNPRWIGAFAKLKQAAEKAKIRLSSSESQGINIDSLCSGEDGGPVGFEYELARRDIEPLMDPFIERSINISRKVLSEKKLKPEHIERVILVGGPTLSPYLRGRLEDARSGIGIKLDFGVDPLTVVARGAAIFAGTQRLQGRASAKAPAAPAAGEVVLELVYEPICSDPESPVAGRVLSPADPSGITLEFVNPDAKPPWRSGKVGVGRDGSFMTTVWADEDRRNTFLVEARDARGNALKTSEGGRSPATLSVTLGNKPAQPPLTHSVGVAMANGETDVFVQKGTALPVRKRGVHKTVRQFKRGSAEDFLRIPVVEGDNRRAERNRLIGALVIPSSRVLRDMPAQCEVEITLDIDASRLVKTKAFIPVLDEEFEQVLDLRIPEASLEENRREAGAARNRFRDLKEKLSEVGAGGDGGAQRVIGLIEQEQMEREVEASLQAAGTDPDAPDKCRRRIQELNRQLDELEKALEWPGLLREAQESLDLMRKAVRDFGRRSSDKSVAESLERDLQLAIDAREPKALRQKIDHVDRFRFGLLQQQPEWWVGFLQWLEERIDTMSDRQAAQALAAKARRAIDADDLEGLKGAVGELGRLLPDDQRSGSPFQGGTIR